MRKYTGKDFSGNWKVVTNEGKIVTFVSKDGKIQSLTGFDGYRSAAEAAVLHGGVPVRE